MKLSIIIPYDRYKNYLHDCLESISQQQITDYETLLVVNDENDLDEDLKAYDIEELEEFVSILSEVKELSGLEINLNCPYGNFAVPSYWKNPEKLVEMIQRVKAAAGEKILWFKAPTAEYSPDQIVSLVQENG